MTTRLKFHPSDQRADEITSGNIPTFRKGDVIVIGGRFYPVEDFQYDLDKSEASYWLEAGYDQHPTAPAE